jgi:hypothetical protein
MGFQAAQKAAKLAFGGKRRLVSCEEGDKFSTGKVKITGKIESCHSNILIWHDIRMKLLPDFILLTRFWTSLT